MRNDWLYYLSLAVLLPAYSIAASGCVGEDHSIINQQRSALAKNTLDQGFGPQSPRDIDARGGKNTVVFTQAPDLVNMNLCNIHFHKNAEHKGGEFTTYAGDGDGQGFSTGYLYSGELTPSELTPLDAPVCVGEHGGLQAGDTIEVHYVYTTAPVRPGLTLAACVNNSINNPQLRVEAQVVALVNDKSAGNFLELAKYQNVNGYYQAVNIPDNTGTPVRYSGSSTSAAYNEKGSPFLVSWGVRPKVAKVDIGSVGAWCGNNTFQEYRARSTRNLIINPDLLSTIPANDRRWRTAAQSGIG